VVGTPAYLLKAPAAHARRSHPSQLRAVSAALGRRRVEWPFERNRKSRRIAVDGRVMVNDMDLAIRAALDGLGIAYTIEALAEPFIRSGQLVRVLEDWSPSLEGLFLYYSGRRQVPATLRVLIDMIRAARGAAPSKRPLQNPFTRA
jgi:DNA-binding transcriptional LysR family regulator